jgi:hypothetical protein
MHYIIMSLTEMFVVNTTGAVIFAALLGSLEDTMQHYDKKQEFKYYLVVFSVVNVVRCVMSIFFASDTLNVVDIALECTISALNGVRLTEIFTSAKTKEELRRYNVIEIIIESAMVELLPVNLLAACVIPSSVDYDVWFWISVAAAAGALFLLNYDFPADEKALSDASKCWKKCCKDRPHLSTLSSTVTSDQLWCETKVPFGGVVLIVTTRWIVKHEDFAKTLCKMIQYACATFIMIIDGNLSWGLVGAIPAVILSIVFITWLLAKSRLMMKSDGDKSK